ncbi:MAG: flavin reductase family protein [Lachnospiraceae bacterium]|nr:flavin reductase family protein [Lachnospiraceae bacterium]
MKEITVSEIKDNLFDVLKDKWALVSAGTEEKCNTMTVSWGGFGIFWNKPTATIYIRPQRYTKEFIDACDCFSISVLPEEFREALKYCGVKSGRDVADKFEAAGITKAFEDGVPYVKEAQMVLVCKKLCEGDIDPDTFLEKENDAINYPNKDYHRYYIAEIKKVMVQ